MMQQVLKKKKKEIKKTEIKKIRDYYRTKNSLTSVFQGGY